LPRTPTSKDRVRLEEDQRIGTAYIKKARWFCLELSFDRDLHDAFDWLGQAYESAVKNRPSSL
jgi:hypothetical protein